RERALLLHYPQRALEGWPQLIRPGDRSLAVQLKGARKIREIDVRLGDLRADPRVFHRALAVARDVDRVLLGVVERAVVMHHREHRYPVVRGGPQRAWREEQVAVRLQVDDQPIRATGGQPDTDRGSHAVAKPSPPARPEVLVRFA